MLETYQALFDNVVSQCAHCEAGTMLVNAASCFLFPPKWLARVLLWLGGYQHQNHEALVCDEVRKANGYEILANGPG